MSFTPEEVTQRLLGSLKYLEETLQRLQGAVTSCEKRIEELSQAKVYAQKDLIGFEKTLNDLRFETDKLRDWSESVKPIIFSAGVTKDELLRMDQRISEYHDAMDDLKKEVAQSTFSDERIADAVKHLTQRLAALEGEMDDMIAATRSYVKDSFVSKNEFLNLQRNFLWGFLTFAFTSVVAWVMGKF